MSASHRICETCVYCSFAGNCDRYDKPLTSIEQPACDSYEIHPLLAENSKLRKLVRDMWDFFCVVPDYEPYTYEEELDFSIEVWKRMRELGVEGGNDCE